MWKVVVPAVAILGLLLAGALHHRNRARQQRRVGSITLEAILTAERGKAGKPFPVRFVLHNQGVEPLLVVTRAQVYGGSEFSAHVHDSDGEWWRNKRSPFLLGEVTLPDFVRLGPNESVEVRDETFSGWTPPAGRFRVAALFRFEPPAAAVRLHPAVASLLRQTVPLDLSTELEIEVDR